jgi:hypothetical protein
LNDLVSTLDADTDAAAAATVQAVA